MLLYCHARRPASSPCALTPASASFQDVPPEHSIEAHAQRTGSQRHGSKHAYAPTHELHESPSRSATPPRSSALGEFALSLCERRQSLLNSHKCADAPQLFLCAARRHIAESGLELLAPLADTRRQSQGTSLCSLLRRRRLLVSARHAANLPLTRQSLDTLFRRLTLRRYAFSPSHTS